MSSAFAWSDLEPLNTSEMTGLAIKPAASAAEKSKHEGALGETETETSSQLSAAAN